MYTVYSDDNYSNDTECGLRRLYEGTECAICKYYCCYIVDICAMFIVITTVLIILYTIYR